MSDCAVAGRDDDLEQICAYRQVCRDAQQINQARHPDVTGPPAQESAKKATHKSNH